MKRMITIAVLILTGITAEAQTYVHLGATGNNDGTSWTNAFTNLQDAIDATGSETEIWIAAGTYLPEGPTPDSSHFIATHAVHLYGGFVGTETSLSQRDWNINPSIISGDLLQDDIPGNFSSNRTDNAHHVLIVNSPNETSIIDGIVFQGGMTRVDAFVFGPEDMPYHRWSGGALYVYQSGAVIRNCLFHDNISGARGSGCYAFGDTLHTISLQLENVVFRDNDGYNGSGGFFQAYQDLSLKNCHFSNNTGFQGGAAFFSGTNAMVEDCVFESNSAAYGGAINGFHSNLFIKYPIIHLNRTIFTGNTSTSTGGGVYYNNTYGGFSFVADSCTFTENETDFIGGGLVIYDRVDALPNDAKSIISVTNSTFTANVAVYGGGADIETWDDSTQIDIINTHFVDNISDQAGGLWLAFSDAAIANCVLRGDEFRGNSALRGGGLLIDIYENTFPLHYLLEDCMFLDNESEVGGAGMMARSFTQPGGIIGTIRNTEFISNHGVGTGGAIYSWQEYLTIEDSYFVANSTEAAFDSSYHGGGAITIDGPAEMSMKRNIFENNISFTDGAAITVNANVTGYIDNSLFHNQEGNSTIYSNGELRLLNNTIVENENGLFLTDVSAVEVQNSIFNNTNENLQIEGKPEVISNGGNISSDATMTAVLTGNGNFEDLHNTDPLLGADFVPLSGSPCIDAGNPEGIDFPYDLAGNPRVHGGAIDIGSYESFLVATHDAQWNASSLKVYPNPVKDNLHFILEMEAIGDLNLTLYSSTGQVVHRARLNKTDYRQSFSENIMHLTPGKYVVLASMGDITFATNVIIQP